MQGAALLLLGAVWGASYIFIRVLVEPLGPIFLMFLRVALSGLLLYGYARLKGARLQIRERWQPFLILGILGSALPFTLIGWSELTLTGSMAAVLNSATPLFTTFVAAVGLRERLTPYKLIGALLGIIGVSIVVGGSPLDLDAEVLLAVLASLGAGLSYAVSGVFAKRSFYGVDNLSLATGQLLGAGFVLAPLTLFDPPQGTLSPAAALSLLALIVVCTACAYQLYYYLIISAGPTKALTVTLLVPVFGVMWGALLLQEDISSGMLLGLAIVLLSVGLVTGIISPRRRAPTEFPAP